MFRPTRGSLIASCLSALLWVASTATAADYTIPITATITSGPTPPAPRLEQQSTTSLSATADTSTVSQEAIARGPTWSWSYTVFSRTSATGSYQSASSGYAVDISPSNQASATLTASFTLAAYWKINATASVTYSDDNDTWSGQATVAVNLKAVQVGLTAIPVVEYSLVRSGFICLNAQSTYQSAKFQATVLPDGTTATVTKKSSSVADVTGSPGTVSNNGAITVTGGSTTGVYTLVITHSENSTCTAEDGGTVFKIVIRADDPDGSGLTEGPTPDNDQGAWYVKATAVNSAGAKGGADRTCVRHAWFETEPADAYSGNLKAIVKFYQKIEDKAASSGYGLKVWNDVPDPIPQRTYTFDFGIVKWAATFTSQNRSKDSAGFQYQCTLTGPNGGTQRVPSNLSQQIAPGYSVLTADIPSGSYEKKLSLGNNVIMNISELIDATHARSIYTVGSRSSCATGFVQLSAACATTDGTPHAGAWVDVMLEEGKAILFDIGSNLELTN